MWDTLAHIAMLPVVLALGAVVLVPLALPWIAVAWVFAYLTRGRMPDRARVAIASLVVACGLAPLIYAHGAINVYIVAMDGGKPPLVQSLVSIGATWLVLFVLGSWWLARRDAGPRPAAKERQARDPRVLGMIAVAGLAVVAVLVYRWYVNAYGDAQVRVVTVSDPPVVALTVSSGTCPALEPRFSYGRRVFLAECILTSKPTRIAARCADDGLPEAYIEHAFEPRDSSNYVLFEGVCESSPEEIRAANQRAAGTSVWRAKPSTPP